MQWMTVVVDSICDNPMYKLKIIPALSKMSYLC